MRVDLERTSDGLQVMIADEGPGFDFEKYLILDRERLFHTHGRGVLLASSTLDLAYTPPGNQVTVSIPS